jgi:DNA-directed RNA polymerase specialized sigma24 family protein
VLTIAGRKAIDCIRARSRAPIAVADVPEPPARGAAEAPGPESDPWEAVRNLPLKQRTAVALRYALDDDYALIASTMGTTQDAARRNVHEGLKRLRTEYRP